jgi:hypothetical protein
MIFWDASALVPLLVTENESAYCINALDQDREVLIWSLTPVEIVSALSRRRREGVLHAEEYYKAKKRLQLLVDSAYQESTSFETEKRDKKRKAFPWIARRV